jgi:hypothetical protein
MHRGAEGCPAGAKNDCSTAPKPQHVSQLRHVDSAPNLRESHLV